MRLCFSASNFTIIDARVSSYRKTFEIVDFEHMFFYRKKWNFHFIHRRITTKNSRELER